jgi:hypothetical protein
MSGHTYNQKPTPPFPAKLPEHTSDFSVDYMYISSTTDVDSRLLVVVVVVIVVHSWLRMKQGPLSTILHGKNSYCILRWGRMKGKGKE